MGRPSWCDSVGIVVLAWGAVHTGRFRGHGLAWGWEHFAVWDEWDMLTGVFDQTTRVQRRVLCVFVNWDNRE